MVASLAMYHYPWTAAAHDRLWVLIRDGLRMRGITAPDALDRTIGHMEAWARPDLTLSQICNLPYRARFQGKVTLIAACDYGLEGAGPGLYYSVLLVRRDDPARTLSEAAGYPMAINEPLSQSGWGAPAQFAAAQGLRLNPVLRTGTHAQSMQAVAEGRADLAALDAISFRNFCGHNPFADRVRILARTHTSPGMTMITRAGEDPAPYRAAIAEAIARLPAPDRQALGLRGITVLPDAAYDIPLPLPPPGLA
jgi:ABC-type phosphate/phosphonate transport system substrate-binding protein